MSVTLRASVGETKDQQCGFTEVGSREEQYPTDLERTNKQDDVPRETVEIYV